MTKLIAPLLSIAAHGKISSNAYYARRKGVNHARAKTLIPDPKSPLQLQQRSMMKSFVEVWNLPGIRQTLRDGWDRYALISRRFSSGYHAFIHFANEYARAHPSTSFAANLAPIPAGTLRFQPLFLRALHVPTAPPVPYCFAGLDKSALTNRGLCTQAARFWTTPALGAPGTSMYVQIISRAKPRTGIELHTLL